MKRIYLAAGSLVVAAIVSTVALSSVEAQVPAPPTGLKHREKHGEQYLMVKSQNSTDFMKAVSERLREGYHLHGGTIVKIDRFDNERFYQALIR